MFLSEKQRTAYRLYHQRKLRQQEIAELMQVSQPAVAQLISRAETRVKALRLACIEAGGDCKVIDAILS